MIRGSGSFAYFLKRLSMTLSRFQTKIKSNVKVVRYVDVDFLVTDWVYSTAMNVGIDIHAFKKPLKYCTLMQRGYVFMNS